MLSILFIFLYQALLTDLPETKDPVSYDLVIVGGTPAGIMTAIAAERMGKTCLLLERTDHPGGLPVNGLGATDLHTPQATGGLFSSFVGRIEEHYRKTYGLNSEQHRSSKKGFRFEPHVAEKVFQDMLRAHPGIIMRTGQQFDARTENVTLRDLEIRSIRILDREQGTYYWVEGKVFIDATYEGDLMAAAGIPYALGRESREETGELLAGKVYKAWEGAVGSGSTFEADSAIQAYNYRLCLSKDPGRSIPIEKPENFQRAEYLSLVNDVQTGRHTGKSFQRYQNSSRNPGMTDSSQSPPGVPGDPFGMDKIVHLSGLPNAKYDANNQELALISTDLPEENWAWPEADWAWRDQFAKRLKEYTLGLLWFAQNDPELPLWFRRDCRQWGLAADEYRDNGHFPRQVYVREGRRMKGLYFYTLRDVLPSRSGQRPRIHSHSVSSGHYSADSHGVRKREPGRIHLDGFLSIDTQPFTIPYEVMVPVKIKNLLCPVALSGSHLGYSTLRMEPSWMALGEAAGVAAALSIDLNTPLQQVPITTLQLELLQQGAILMYYKDLSPSDPYFQAIQLLGLQGIFPEWYASPGQVISSGEIKKTEQAFSLDLGHLKKKALRREAFASAVLELLKAKEAAVLAP